MRRGAVLCALALGLLPAAAGADALCHVNYGGEDLLHRVAATDDPYRVPTTAIGSYFLFRAVLEAAPQELAALKVYVLADLERGPLPIHHGEYPWPATAGQRFGFTGRQRVYEPLRDGELSYWCEVAP